MPGEGYLERASRLEAAHGHTLQKVTLALGNIVLDRKEPGPVIACPDQFSVGAVALPLGPQHIEVAVAVKVVDCAHVVQGILGGAAKGIPYPSITRVARLPVPPPTGDDVWLAIAVQIATR